METTRIAKVIAIVGLKGGGGKTLTSILTSDGISRKEKNSKVLLIDCDLQQTAFQWWDKDDKNEDGTNKNFFFNVTTRERKQYPDEIIARERFNYDYIIVDCPPKKSEEDELINEITYSALLTADLAIMPLLCSPVDMWEIEGVYKAIDQIKAIQKNNRQTLLKHSTLLTEYVERETLSQAAKIKVEGLNQPLMKSKLCKRTSYRMSAFLGKSIFTLPSKDYKAIAEVKSLAIEAIDLLNDIN